MHRFFCANFTLMLKDSTGNLILKGTLIGLLANLFLSYKIWIGNEFVPRFPVSDVFAIPDALSTLLLILIGAGSIFTLYKIDKRVVIGIAGLLAFAMLTDWNKAQPYFVHYLLFVVLWLFSVKDKIAPYVLAISGIYLWSGIHKINPFYFEDVIYNLSYAVDDGLYKDLLIESSKAIPYVEVILAILLLIPRLFKIASIISIALHAGIIVFLIQIGYNYAVWPWNLVFILFHVITLLKKSKLTYEINISNAVATALFIVFPIVNVYTHNFAYQSWNLYSGRIPYGVAYVLPENAPYLPDGIREELIDERPYMKLDLTPFSVNMTGVAINPDPWIYDQWYQHLCDQYGSSNFIFGTHLYGFEELESEYKGCQELE